jgi:hypothetical protein
MPNTREIMPSSAARAKEVNPIKGAMSPSRISTGPSSAITTAVTPNPADIAATLDRSLILKFFHQCKNYLLGVLPLG